MQNNGNPDSEVQFSQFPAPFPVSLTQPKNSFITALRSLNNLSIGLEMQCLQQNKFGKSMPICRVKRTRVIGGSLALSVAGGTSTSMSDRRHFTGEIMWLQMRTDIDKSNVNQLIPMVLLGSNLRI